MKNYHLYLYRPGFSHEPYEMPSALTVGDVEYAVQIEKPIISTFQVITCTTRLFLHGYRIFVHAAPDDVYEITLGKNERTNREIRMNTCLYNLILSGEFTRSE